MENCVALSLPAEISILRGELLNLCPFHISIPTISASKERIEFSYQFLDACLVILLMNR
jgi:hypothetical protein